MIYACLRKTLGTVCGDVSAHILPATRYDVQLATSLAKIPSRSPCPEKESLVHDVRICSVVWASLSQEEIPRRIQSERGPRIAEVQ